MEEIEESEGKEMSFWDHLEAFRWTLVRSLGALLVFAIGSYFTLKIVC